MSSTRQKWHETLQEIVKIKGFGFPNKLFYLIIKNSAATWKGHGGGIGRSSQMG